MMLTEIQKTRFKQLLKGILSIWILFHIVVMILMPNLASFPGRTFESWIAPYGNALGLNATWNFFSPDPAHTMYLQYIVFYESDEGEIQEPQEYFIPQNKNKPIYDTRKKRDLYAMRFMILSPDRLKKLMGPWLCSRYAGATSIQLNHVIETVPPLQEAITFEKMTLKELSKEIPYASVLVNCLNIENEQDEVAL